MGQGKGQAQPKSSKAGLGRPANISIESRISNAPATIRSHFDAVNMLHLLLP